MKKFVTLLLICILLISCGNSGNSLKDGDYTGTYSSEGDNRSTVNVKIKIKQGKIQEVIAEELDKNGKIKDENYGKNSGDKNYKLAQKAVKNFKEYPNELIKKQNIDEVEAISGATISHKLFKEAVKNALNNK